MNKFQFAPWLGGICVAAAFAAGFHTSETTDSIESAGRVRTATRQVKGAGLLGDSAMEPPDKTRSSRKDHSMATRLKVDVEKVIYVGGQVRAPGTYPLTSGMILYLAIHSAGGVTEFGSLKRVKLFREGTQQVYDLTDPKWMRVPLKPNDTIDVTQKNVFAN